MIHDETFRKLKKALIEKFGAEVNDPLSSEKLSIEIFLTSGNYVSQSTIMRLFGIVKKEGCINTRILDILREYANL